MSQLENRYQKIVLPENKNAAIRIIPGHFATSHSHINYYVDMTILKSRKSEAAAAATVLAYPYTNTTIVDTIICMDGCEVVGAYLADSLTEGGIMSMNAHQTMYIVSPETNSEGQLIFRDNMQMMIRNKHCLLLLASATTGRTIARALECIDYYGGRVAGISAIFSAAPIVNGYKINSLFNASNLPGYQTYDSHNCPLCQQGVKLDAIVNSFGYSALL